jgi:Replication-relaxation
MVLRRDSTDPNGRPLVMGERDRAILELLDPQFRFKYLPSNWIHAFIGGNWTGFRKRLARMKRRPQCYLVRPKQQDVSENARYKHDVYARSDAGARFLGTTNGSKSYKDREYAHDLLTDLVDASIELGVRADKSLRLLTWRELATHKNVPLSTRLSPFPFRVPLGTQAGRDQYLEPDGRPLIVEKRDATAFRCNLYLLKEIDLNTEPLTSSTARASWQRKFERYKLFFDNKLYERHYGFHSCLVLVVTTSEQRMQALLDMNPPSYFLFRTEPNHARAPHFPKPNADMMTEPWKRAAETDFCLNDPKPI